jgi:hypothetical protein
MKSFYSTPLPFSAMLLCRLYFSRRILIFELPPNMRNFHYTIFDTEEVTLSWVLSALTIIKFYTCSVVLEIWRQHILQNIHNRFSWIKILISFHDNYQNSHLILNLKTSYYIIWKVRLLAGQANIFESPQIANPQILGFIPQLQNCKFLRCASPQIGNPPIFIMNPQIANPQISTKFWTSLFQNRQS